MRCTDFRRDRKEKHSDFFFCHQCDLYDALPPDFLGRVNKNSTRYQCKGNHKSRIFPTTTNIIVIIYYLEIEKKKELKR